METVEQDSAGSDRLINRAVGPSSRPRARVVSLSPHPEGGPPQLTVDDDASGKRDWASALDLVSEAFEAIRQAGEHAAALEEFQTELVRRHADQVKVLETRIAAAERHADAAEARAKTAEGWLSKFYDTITGEFQRTFALRQHGDD